MKYSFLNFLILFFAYTSYADQNTVPNQIHIALASFDSSGNAMGLSISWQTISNTATSVVKFGTSSKNYVYSATGASSSYYETFHHHVVLSKLTPNTVYYYIVGDESGGFSKEFKATTAPLSTDLRGNFSFAVFGDLGVANGEASIAFMNDIASKDEVKLIWHGGDISYADDSFLHKGCAFKFCYEQVWDEYMNLVEPTASHIPYMVAVGNHEAECHDPACLSDKDRREKLSNFTAYNTRFRMPSAESGAFALNMHFSFNYGNVHFISIDTETGYPGAAEETRYVLPCGGFSDQLKWLENDLIEANKNRALRPWIFAQGHHPMYQGDSVNEGFQAAMEDLFYKYGVDIYFSGHVHHYERNYPVYKKVPESSYVNPRATTYLMIGGAGNDEMKDDQVVDPSPVEDESTTGWKASLTEGSWTAKVDEGYFGTGKITIIDDSTLTFNYYRTTTGEPYDSFTLKRDHSEFINNFSK